MGSLFDVPQTKSSTDENELNFDDMLSRAEQMLKKNRLAESKPSIRTQNTTDTVEKRFFEWRRRPIANSVDRHIGDRTMQNEPIDSVNEKILKLCTQTFLPISDKKNRSLVPYKSSPGAALQSLRAMSVLRSPRTSIKMAEIEDELRKYTKSNSKCFDTGTVESDTSSRSSNNFGSAYPVNGESTIQFYKKIKPPTRPLVCRRSVRTLSEWYRMDKVKYRVYEDDDHSTSSSDKTKWHPLEHEPKKRRQKAVVSFDSDGDDTWDRMYSIHPSSSSREVACSNSGLPKLPTFSDQSLTSMFAIEDGRAAPPPTPAISSASLKRGANYRVNPANMWNNLIKKIEFVEGSVRRKMAKGKPPRKSDSMQYCFKRIMTTGFISAPESLRYQSDNPDDTDSDYIFDEWDNIE